MESSLQESEVEVKEVADSCAKETTYPSIRLRIRTLLPLMGFCFCFYIGVNGWATLLPQYIVARLRAKDENASVIEDYCNINESDPLFLKEKQLQKRAASISSVASFCAGVPCMFMVLIYSSISDQLGRKVTIAIPYVGGCIVGITLAVVVAFDGPFWLYFIANFINGFSGSSSAILAGVYSSVADVTPPERRSVSIAIIQSSLCLGMILSNLLIGGFWAQKVGFVPPFIFISVLIICCGGFFFVIRETRPREQILAARSLGVVGAVKKQLSHMKNTVFMDHHRMKQIFIVVIAIVLSMLAYMGNAATLTLYVLGQPFCWQPKDVGAYNATNIAVSVIGTTLVVIFLKRFLSDLTLAMLGGASFLGFFVITGCASFIKDSFHNVLMLAAIPVGAVATLPSVALKGLGSSLVSQDEQGAFFGVVAIGEAFSFSFGPVIMNSIYTGTVTTMNFFVYFFCAGLLALMLLLLVIYKLFLEEQKSTYDMTNDGFSNPSFQSSDNIETNNGTK